MSVVIIGIGDPAHHDWAVGPRVVARLAEESMPGVYLVSCIDDPRWVIDGDRQIDEVIIVRAARDGGRPGLIHQFIVESPGSRQGDGLPCTPAGGGVDTWIGAMRMPKRVVVYTVEARDHSRGSDPGDEVEAAVEHLARVIVRDINRATRTRRQGDHGEAWTSTEPHAPDCQRLRADSLTGDALGV